MTSPPSLLSASLSERYAIEREIGAGGMASVYLARDVRHSRKVALKVLHPELSAVLGGERFLKEIELTANLQHPHILPLFDSGEAAGQLFYVMPFVDGETLRARLERERQLPINDALRIAREVADALQYAHERGVVHRDIKPENILLQGGHALVADFGIALAVQQAGGARMTQTGLSLGTPQYMAPEQAMGEKTVDARADVYALGAVTYEMLAGEPPFTGPTAQAIVARILTAAPAPITQLRSTVPPSVAAAVTQSLEKLPADRIASARAFADALADVRFTYDLPISSAQRGRPVGSARGSRQAWIGGAVLALVGLASAAWTWRQRSEPGELRPVVPLMLDVPTANPDLGRFAVSGDGARFVFANDEGLALRAAGETEYRILDGTAQAESPTFSPDGAWIAYHVNGHLRKIALAGGTPLPILPNDSLLAGRVHWGEDGSIVFETSSRLCLIPADGGPPRMLTKAIEGQGPRLTPDGRGVLYVDIRRGSRLMYYDLAADSAFAILEESAEGQVLTSGHLVYTPVSGGIFAVHFDLTRHKILGTPVPVASGVQPNGGVAPFFVTRNGTLVYRAGVDPESYLLLRDPSGRLDTLPIAPKVVSYARFSVDGRQLALTIGSARGTNRHTALYDVARHSLTRFTLDGGGHSPVWSPDGRTLAFTAEGKETDAEDLFLQPVDQSARPRLVLRMPNDQHASSWPSDSQLVFSTNTAPRILGGVPTGGSSWMVDPRTPGATAQRYLGAPWGEYDVAVSPNGEWAAYTSTESGPTEVWLRAFPAGRTEGRWKVSPGGGQRPRWSADGRTVYYIANDNASIRAVAITPGATPGIGANKVILQLPGIGSAWDVDRSSGRMVVATPARALGTRMIVLQGWRDQLVRGGGAVR